MQANEVADAAGLQARYVEEWLKGMTAAGYLEYDSAADAYLLRAAGFGRVEMLDIKSQTNLFYAARP